jgi:hypothetical protein
MPENSIHVARDNSIHVAGSADGSLSYAIAVPPESLPAVTPTALLGAWDAARARAHQGGWGPPRELLFRRPDGSAQRLAIVDRDARSWAEAVDLRADLATIGGLSLCLRLLALVDVMGRSAWLAGLFRVTAAGAELHPALLRAAASMPLDSGARFDAEALRGLLSRTLPARMPA